MLRVAARDRCDACHTAPGNHLHKALSVGCDTCHKVQAWKPATFDHDTSFPLDKDHNAPCVTCHTGNNTQQYTGYGCHEHTPANMQVKHREEGVSESLDDCVRCHRSASGELADKGQREGGNGRRSRD